MPQNAVETIIGRAVTDLQFRDLLFADPKTALAEYTLTDEEREALMKMKQEDVEAFANKLDERITKTRWW